MRNRFVVVLVALALTVGLTNTITAQEKETVPDMQQNWGIDLNLDMPTLIPPAVQWAIFDYDPVPGFNNRIVKMRDFIDKQMKTVDNPRMENIARNSLSTAYWDMGFRETTGDLVYLLTTAPATKHSMTSNTPAGKKWLVSKIAKIKGEPVCWCLPIEVSPGSDLKVTLTAENVFDLSGAFTAAREETAAEE